MHILPYLFRFHPRNEGPSCLKGACGCVNLTIYKKCQSNFLKLFLKKHRFKKSHLNTTEGGPVDPSPHFLGSGARES